MRPSGRGRAARLRRRRRTVPPRASRRRRSAARASATATSGVSWLQARASSRRHSDVSKGSWVWVNPSSASRSHALRIALPGVASGQRDQGARVRRRVRLGAGREIGDRLLRVLAAGQLGLDELRPATGCTRCCPGRPSARRARAGRARPACSPRARCSAARGRTRLAVGQALQQARGLVVPALLDPQVGQPDQRTGLERRACPAPTAAPPRSAPRRPRASARRR